MPYLDREHKENKEHLKRALMYLGSDLETKAELNWAICTVVLGFLRSKTKNYQTLSDAVGALYDASHEVRRRILDPYEDGKIKENGDIFDV
jgi:hypothetical protein